MTSGAILKTSRFDRKCHFPRVLMRYDANRDPFVQLNSIIFSNCSLGRPEAGPIGRPVYSHLWIVVRF